MRARVCSPAQSNINMLLSHFACDLEVRRQDEKQGGRERGREGEREGGREEEREAVREVGRREGERGEAGERDKTKKRESAKESEGSSWLVSALSHPVWFSLACKHSLSSH